jgi:hypothetical protein
MYLTNIYIASCKCKRFICVNVNDLHLHEIYMPYIWLLTLTHATLVITNRGWLLEIGKYNRTSLVYRIVFRIHNHDPQKIKGKALIYI